MLFFSLIGAFKKLLKPEHTSRNVRFCIKKRKLNVQKKLLRVKCGGEEILS